MSTCYRWIIACKLNSTPIIHRRQIQRQSIIRGFKTVEISRIGRTTHRRRGICLRRTSEGTLREWAVESVESGGGVSIGSDGIADDDSKVGMCSCLCEVEDRNVGDDVVSALGMKEENRDRDRAVEVLVAAAFTVVLGVGNRVMYKLALVPLKQYPFFLAQLATFGKEAPKKDFRPAILERKKAANRLAKSPSSLSFYHHHLVLEDDIEKFNGFLVEKEEEYVIRRKVD